MAASEKQFRKRNAILACLQQTKQHPSAETLYQSLRQEHPDISLATVYRNLALFRNQGLILSLGPVGGTERFDGDTSPHDHFVCRHCGCVLDLPHTKMPEAAVNGAAQELGCQIDGYQLMFTGTCRNCLNQRN